MKWLRRVLLTIAGIPFVLLSVIVAESITGGKIGAQQRPLPRHTVVAAQPGTPWWMLMARSPLKVTEYSQPFIYSVWWGEIASCEGLPVPDSALQASVQFFSVPTPYFASEFQGMLAGTYDYEPAVYIGAPYVWEEGIVKHEMLHMLLHWEGFELKNFHPAELFERPDCGIHIFANVHS